MIHKAVWHRVLAVSNHIAPANIFHPQTFHPSHRKPVSRATLVASTLGLNPRPLTVQNLILVPRQWDIACDVQTSLLTCCSILSYIPGRPWTQTQTLNFNNFNSWKLNLTSCGPVLGHALLDPKPEIPAPSESQASPPPPRNSPKENSGHRRQDRPDLANPHTETRVRLRRIGDSVQSQYDGETSDRHTMRVRFPSQSQKLQRAAPVSSA